MRVKSWGTFSSSIAALAGGGLKGIFFEGDLFPALLRRWGKMGGKFSPALLRSLGDDESEVLKRGEFSSSIAALAGA